MQIDSENRVLLEKMMRIDLNPSRHHPKQNEPQKTPSSLSMNRLVRLKELVRVNEGNKLIVKKLRAIRGTYDVKKWDQQFNQNKYMHDQIRENASNYLDFLTLIVRYSKNPYFVYSGTPQANTGLLSPSSTVTGALQGFSKKSTKNSIKQQYRPYSSINRKLSIMDVDFGNGNGNGIREQGTPKGEASAP